MEVLIMELNEKTKDFLSFNRKIMTSRDGKKRVIVNNKLEEIKYKNLNYEVDVKYRDA